MKTHNNSDEEVTDGDRAIGRAFIGSVIGFCLIAICVGVGYWIAQPSSQLEIAENLTVSLPEKRTNPTVKVPVALWTDITQEAGIDFVHTNGARGEKLLPETMGGGCAFLDFDGDGDQDLLFVNSCQWPGDPESELSPATLALYQNDGLGKFSNVTEKFGLNVSLYGMGIACGDYDGDGDVDLFVSCLGADHLFRNDLDRFVDVSDLTGVAGKPDAWSVSCGWFDYDQDGDLDLMVTHYVEWSREFDLAQNFRLLGGSERAYGRPQAFAGTVPSLFRNNGQGKFEDVSFEAGLEIKHNVTAAATAKSLGLAFEDVNDDGCLDCVVSNDTTQNFLFVNKKDGTFDELATLAGIAYDSSGAARGAMGIDVAAFRNDASIGIAIGNFANEMSALYVARGRDLQFYDAAVANGFGPATRLELTFGILFLDFDLDGRLDLIQSNGHLEQDIARVQTSQKYEQSPQLFWNAGADFDSEFILCRQAETGPDLPKPMVGRGLSCADIDRDGDLDIVLVGCGQPPRLLRNDQALGNHWLRVKLIGSPANPDAIGARVAIKIGDEIQQRLVSPTRSYLSQVELPVTFGLGQHGTIDQLTITWPNGVRQVIQNVAIDRELVLRHP